VEAAHVLLEELYADPTITNADGATAEEKIRAEGDYPVVADYLLETRMRTESSSDVGRAASSGAQHLPPLPPNVTINVGTLDSVDAGEGNDQTPDPEFRRRIEELATRDDFEAEQGQQDLRNLIKDAVRGVASSGEKEVRRRMS